MRKITEGIAFIVLACAPIVALAGKGAYLRIHNLTDKPLQYNTEAKSGISEGGDFDGIVAPDQSSGSMYVESSSWATSTTLALGLKVDGSYLKVAFSEGGRQWRPGSVQSSDNYQVTRAVVPQGDQYAINIYVQAHTAPHQWMSRSADVQRSSLRDICMPGAHDAAMGKAHSCSTYANWNSTQTQDASVYDLLSRGGVRYFDLRAIIDEQNGLALGHSSFVGKDISLGLKTLTLRMEGCLGYSVDDVITDVSRFLDENKNAHELVLLEFSHFMNWKKHAKNDNKGFDDEDIQRLANEISRRLGASLVKGDSNALTNRKLSDLTSAGSRVIVVFDTNSSVIDGSNGIHKLSALGLINSYADSEDYGSMRDDQFRKLRENAGKNFLLSWTLTQKSDSTFVKSFTGLDSIAMLAGAANSRTFEVVDHVREKKLYPNIFMNDFSLARSGDVSGMTVCNEVNKQRLK